MATVAADGVGVNAAAGGDELEVVGNAGNPSGNTNDADVEGGVVVGEPGADEGEGNCAGSNVGRLGRGGGGKIGVGAAACCAKLEASGSANKVAARIVVPKRTVAPLRPSKFGCVEIISAVAAIGIIGKVFQAH